MQLFLTKVFFQKHLFFILQTSNFWMVVYMKASKDERMQNVVFQYNESQSSTEKYICFPP